MVGFREFEVFFPSVSGKQVNLDVEHCPYFLDIGVSNASETPNPHSTQN